MIRSKKGIVVVAAAFLVTALALPAVQAAPDTPYYGKEYSQPEKVLKLYPDPDVRFETPAFTSGQERFTSQEEMIQFLRKLDESSPWTVMKSLGRSQEGREMPVLFFKRGSGKGKPTVWLQGQIHSNETAAGESVLVTAPKPVAVMGKTGEAHQCGAGAPGQSGRFLCFRAQDGQRDGRQPRPFEVGHAGGAGNPFPLAAMRVSFPVGKPCPHDC